MDQGAADKSSIAADKSEGALDTSGEVSTTGEDKVAEPDDQASEKHFEFLELPPELRNAIYAAILEDCSVTIPRSPGRPLQISSALIGVNKMIQDEFRSYATLEAPVIRANVSNLNFGHVITYLNRLEETQLKRLEHASSTKKSAAQTIKIELTMTIRDRLLIPYPQADRWLNRFDISTKRAAEVHFEYAGMPNAMSHGGELSRGLIRSAAHREPRSAKEAKKIVTAVKKAWFVGQTFIEIV